MPPAKQRTPELRDHVLAVALRTLADDGVAGLTARRVAERASTSPPAIYELFGDKAGLVRGVFFAGFDRLGEALAALPVTDDPLADLRTTAAGFRRFAAAEPVLAEVMFARPFADFDPAPEEARAGARVASTWSTGCGPASPPVSSRATSPTSPTPSSPSSSVWRPPNGPRLGTSRRSVDRRWRTALDALLRGFAPAR